MQTYATQVSALADSVLALCGPGVQPQALAPHIHPHGSGVATCQLADPSHSDSEDEQQQQGTVWDHSEQHGVSDSLPELEQLLHSNRRLLVTLLVDAAPRRYQQAQQQQQQQHPGPDPNASGSGASSGTNKESDTPNCSRNSSGSGHISTGSPWMHKELHQYLLELQTGEWGPPPAAAAATSGCSGSASCSHQAADCCCGVGDTPPPQAAAAAHTWVPVSQLAWMAAAHPWAARATNARVDTAPPLLMLPGNGRHHLPADTASSSVSTTSRSVAEHLASCGSGSSTHPNLAPVLLLADDCSSCSESATLLPGTAVEDAVAAPAAAGDASSAAAAAAAAVAAPATTAASTTPATTSCSVARCAAVSAQPSAPLDGLLLHYRHHLSGTPDWLGGDWHCRFLLFQLLRALQHLHSKGLAMGGLRAEQLSLVVPGWLLLLAHPAAGLVQPAPLLLPQEVVDPGVADHRAAAASMSLRALPEPCLALPQLTVLWRERRLSNWEYLMWLNAAAGRRWGDRARHPLLPWVLDFTCEPDLTTLPGPPGQPPPGWRDLGISQYRRVKGDAQLDQTYAMSAAEAAGAAAASGSSGDALALPAAVTAARPHPWAWPTPWQALRRRPDGSTARRGGAAAAAALDPPDPPPPHHVSNEPLSELSVAICLARRLPRRLLSALVRRRFRPEEYPSTVQALYLVSPDEAPPQLYSCASSLRSRHAGLADLQVPAWAGDAARFVQLHRAALESEHVSAWLHEWIDLTFGVALSGPAGLAAKNIHLCSLSTGAPAAPPAGNTTTGCSGGCPGGLGGDCSAPRWYSGVRQLFSAAHPARDPPSTRPTSQCTSQWWQPSAAAAAAAAVDAPRAAGPPPGEQELLLPDQQQQPRAAHLLRTAPTTTVPTTPLQLAGSWAQLNNLRAAAAVGAWQDPACSSLGDGGSVGLLSPQQQQLQSHGQSDHVQHAVDRVGAVAVHHTLHQLQQLQQQQRQQNGEDAKCSSVAAADDIAALPSAAAADLAAVGQLVLQMYSRQQSEEEPSVHLLGRAAGVIAAKRGMSAARSAARWQRRGTARDIPAAAALFVQQAGTGQLSAGELLRCGFFPSWMTHAEQFMRDLLYEQVPLQQQQQHDSNEQKCTNKCSLECGAAAWQLRLNAFDSLVKLAAPDGALQRLAEVPEALQLCLPAIMHVLRCRLLLNCTPIAHEQQQQQAAAVVGQEQQAHEQAAGKHSSPSLHLAHAASTVLLRLAALLPPAHLLCELVPLVQELLSVVGSPADNDVGSDGGCSASEGGGAARRGVLVGAAGNGSVPVRSAAHSAAATATAAKAAAHAAACRRAALQPQLWYLLLNKLPAHEALVQQLLPPLLAAVLDPGSGDERGQSAQQASTDAQQQQQWRSPSPTQSHATATSRGRSGVAQLQPQTARLQPQQLPPPSACTAGSRLDDAAAAGSSSSSSLTQLACSVLSLLCSMLPFPVVCQHLLRPLLLALPWTADGGGGGAAAAVASTADSASSVKASADGAARMRAAAGAGGYQPWWVTPQAAAPPNGAAAALCALAAALPPRLAAEFVFMPCLQQALLPLMDSPTAAAASGGNRAAAGEPPGSIMHQSMARATLAALPVLETLLDRLAPVLPASLLLPPPVRMQQQYGSSSSSSAGGGGGGGGPGTDMTVTRSSTSAAAAAAAATAAAASDGEGAAGSGTLGAATNDAQAATDPSTADAAAPAELHATSTGQQLGRPPPTLQDQQQPSAVSIAALHCVLLLPQHEGVAPHHAAAPLFGARVAALVLLALEYGAGRPEGYGGCAGDAALPTVALRWLLPAVLKPLLRQGLSAHWQAASAAAVVRAHWRVVLLPYAAAVRWLGLAAVRQALPDWHSAEVLLTAHTGWDPSQLAAPSISSSCSQTGTRQLMQWLSLQDVTYVEHPTAAVEMERLSRGADMPPVAVAPVAAAAAAPVSADAAGLSADVTGTGALLTTTGSNASGTGTIAEQQRRQQQQVSGGELSDRVSDLLQRIAAEKVARRSLNTTSSFLQGVGWSMPRGTAPPPPPAAGATAATAAAGLPPLPPLPPTAGSEQPEEDATVSRILTSSLPSMQQQQQQISSHHGELLLLPRKSTAAQQQLGGLAAVQQQPTAAAAAEGRGASPAAATDSGNTAAPHAAAPRRPSSLLVAEGHKSSTVHSSRGTKEAASGGGGGWEAELSALRQLLESPTRPPAGGRGPSAGREWFWLLNNTRLSPGHLLPRPAAAAPDVSLSAAAVAASNRAWRSEAGVWWEEGWSLGAVPLHYWPAHRERLRALAVDPWERWVVTAGRGGARDVNAGSAAAPSPIAAASVGSSVGGSSSVVRVWELSDAEAKVQYSGHGAAVNRLAFLGAASSAVASLDVAGCIHIWDRGTGTRLAAFVPDGAATEEAPPLHSTAPRGAAANGGPGATAQQHSSADGASSRTSHHAHGLTADAAAPIRSELLTQPDGTTAAAAAAPPPPQHRSDGYVQRGCMRGRGWRQVNAAARRTRIYNGADDSPGGGVPLGAAPPGRGAAGALALGGLGYTSLEAVGAAAPLADRAGCLATINSLHAAGESCRGIASIDAAALLLAGAAAEAGDSSSGSSPLGAYWLGCAAAAAGAGGGGGGLLLAGTADGHVCLLDVESGALLEDWTAVWEPRQRPWGALGGGVAGGVIGGVSGMTAAADGSSRLTLGGGSASTTAGAAGGWEDPSSSVVSALCGGGGGGGGAGSGARAAGAWLAAGSGGGRAMLLDARAGGVQASWSAHTQRVCQLAPLPGAPADAALVSCSLDRTVKLWDLRMLRRPAAWPGGGSASAAVPLAAFRSAGRDGLEGFVLFQDAAIVHGGAGLGLAPLGAGAHNGYYTGSSSDVASAASSSSAAAARPLRLTPLRGGGGSGSGDTNNSSSVPIVGLGLLPQSKLLVVGCEDGSVRVCR